MPVKANCISEGLSKGLWCVLTKFIWKISATNPCFLSGGTGCLLKDIIEYETLYSYKLNFTLKIFHFGKQKGNKYPSVWYSYIQQD